MTTTAAPSTRLGDLDLLRVVAILLLHLFHTGMMFNSWEWHLKAPFVLAALEPPMVLLHLVRMPLLMLVAGMATAFALRRRTVGAFAKDRTRRLLLPLVFGIFVIVPPQIYVERLFRGQFSGTYVAFYPSVFELVPYPQGSFSWHHLWFVAYLFVFCLALVPVAAALRTARGERALGAIASLFLAGGGAGLFVVAVLLAAIRLLLGAYPETHALFDDPNTVAYYGVLFFTGHLIARMPAVWERLVALRRVLLGLCIAVLAVMSPDWEFPEPFESLGRQLFVWSFLLSALAFTRAHFHGRPRWLIHAQDLAYPFYVFHQTVIVVVGYLLLATSLSGWTLFGAVLAVSFLVTWGACEACGRVPGLRALVGFAPRAQPSGSNAPRVARVEPA